MDSRQKPWERSLATFREHPWLGLGFGVADNSTDQNFTYVTRGHLTRELGSSYLTMLDTTGLIGTFFVALLLLVLLQQGCRGLAWLRSTRKVHNPPAYA